MDFKKILDMPISELEHSGVKGMRWGKRKAQYMSSVGKHETKTKERRAKNDAKIQTKKDNEKALSKDIGKKYMTAANKHEAKTQSKVQAKRDKGTVSIDSRATSNTRANDKRDLGYKNAPGASALILRAFAKSGDKKRANTIIEDTLKTPVSNFDKKSLKNARDLVNKFDNFELKTSTDKKWQTVN